MGLFSAWRRRRLLEEPFPPPWLAILERDVPHYNRLPEPDRAALRDQLRIFIAEKRIEGCNGFEIDDRVRLLIASHAALLILHRNTDVYPLLGTVLVYPTSFAVSVSETDEAGIVTEQVEERLGESWEIGTIVLAWDTVLEQRQGIDRGSGLNVILHEFAHQLDAEDGITDGAPLDHLLADKYRDWTEVCGAEYARMRRNLRRGRPCVLDPYGATSPQEFFAVATETFFERPVRLKAHHPELYAELQRLYGLDPATWSIERPDAVSV